MAKKATTTPKKKATVETTPFYGEVIKTAKKKAVKKEPKKRQRVEKKNIQNFVKKHGDKKVYLCTVNRKEGYCIDFEFYEKAEIDNA